MGHFQDLGVGNVIVPKAGVCHEVPFLVYRIRCKKSVGLSFLAEKILRQANICPQNIDSVEKLLLISLMKTNEKG